MSDILVNKTLQTVTAFQEEFQHILPDNNHTIFYVKRPDNTIFPFKGIAFNNEGVVRVKAMLENNSFTWVLLRENEEIYFTNNPINILEFRSVVTQLSGNYKVVEDLNSLGVIPYSFQ